MTWNQTSTKKLSAKDKFANKKTEKVVHVYLDKGGNPQVQVDEVIWGKPKMRFIKDPDSDEFNFEDFQFTKNAAPFDKPDINNNKKEVKLKNKGDKGGDNDWHYTIKVKVDGDNKTYSTVKNPPGGDRPVIRN